MHVYSCMPSIKESSLGFWVNSIGDHLTNFISDKCGGGETLHVMAYLETLGLINNSRKLYYNSDRVSENSQSILHLVAADLYLLRNQ